jgi:hypothetical protein
MSTAKATPVSDPSRNLLRHTLATLSYRGGKNPARCTRELREISDRSGQPNA